MASTAPTASTLPEIRITRQRSCWLLQTEMWLPQSPHELFPFFADARNLQQLTPRSVRFRILSPLPIEMKKGALIQYRLRLHGFPIHWTTQITEWDPPYRFVDSQVKGPYRYWRHEHQFLIGDSDRGTRAIDRVQYRIRCGQLMHPLFVRRNLLHIFSHRAQVMQQLFGGEAEAGVPGREPEGEADGSGPGAV